MHHVYWYRGPIDMARDCKIFYNYDSQQNFSYGSGQGCQSIIMSVLAPRYLVYGEGSKTGLQLFYQA